MDQRISAVIHYGLSLVGKGTAPPEVKWQSYEQKVGEVNPPQPLFSVLSLVQLNHNLPQAGIPVAPRPLSLKTIMPQASEEKAVVEMLQKEWEMGKSLYAQSPHLLFLVFYNLFRKYAWSLPASRGGAGISLFEQWKTVAAMLFASGQNWRQGPAAEFTLVGGDIPGIQDFVYTITSKGAARGLRGRSLFVQLLGEAVIQRLLSELGLTVANIIYAAGGNFMLLAPRLKALTSAGESTIETALEKIRNDIETALLEDFRGDLALALAWTPLPADEIGGHQFTANASRTLKELIARSKRGRFGGLAKTQWEALFAPHGKAGNRYCVVCQAALAKGEGKGMPQGAGFVCETCASFGELARSFGKARFFSLSQKPPASAERWQKALSKIGHLWFSFDQSGEIVYTLNDADFIAQGAHGFRFLANITPHVTQADLERWRAEPKEGEESPQIGDVRTFGQIAAEAQGIKGLGVLRMDVDNLGQVMIGGLKPRNMASTSALSAALDLFFSGYLNVLCAQVQQEQNRPESLYIIYSGGDDLFIVGAWDLMPLLAEKIQQEFSRYTGDNPSLTISGAATLENEKIPLYQAAERAGAAEDRAKSYRRKHSNLEKNAFDFLGLSVGWEDWKQVTAYRKDIETALAVEKGAPRALLQILQNIYQQYEYQKGKRKAELGPWIWRGAYALSRLGGRVSNEDARQAIDRLAKSCLHPQTTRLVALAAYWVELLTRKEE